MFSALLACNVSMAALADFGDSSAWSLNAYGKGVQVNNVNNGNGFQVNFAADAQPGPIPDPTYAYNMSAHYLSTFSLSGDFTIEMNYSLNVWPSASGLRFGCGLVGAGVGAGGMLREDTTYSSGNAYTFYPSGGGPFTYASTTDQSGMIRLVINGGTLSGFYYNSNSASWVLLGSASGYSGDYQIVASVWTDTSTFCNQEVEVTVNSLSITEAAPPPSFLTNGLVAYYPLTDDGKDASGHGLDLTLSNVVFSTVGSAGDMRPAASFDGMSSYGIVNQTLITGQTN